MLFDEVSEDEVMVQCPYCAQEVAVYIESDVQGEMVQDCDICCRPWSVRVMHDEDGHLHVDVGRAA